MVRTETEEPCYMCHQITNNYDPNAGRVCPPCSVKQIVSTYGNLGESNKHLLTDPLIDHSNDIKSWAVTKSPESSIVDDGSLEFALYGKPTTEFYSTCGSERAALNKIVRQQTKIIQMLEALKIRMRRV